MSNLNELLNNSNIANNKNLTKEIVACFSDYSKEATKMALSQSQLNATQIKAVLVSKGLQGSLLKTTTAELANTTATNAMAATEGTATTATVGFGTAIKGLGASLKALAVAHPILLAITVTLGAIAGAVKIVDALTTSMKEQREAFENAQQDYTDACTKLDELKTKLSETTSRIAELIEKSNNGTITLVEQAELDKLKLTNEELRLMVQNQEEVKKQKAKEASDEAYKTYTRENRMEADDTASKQEQYYQASSDADGFHVGAFLDRASELSDFDYAIKANEQKLEEFQKQNEELQAQLNATSDESLKAQYQHSIDLNNNLISNYTNSNEKLKESAEKMAEETFSDKIEKFEAFKQTLMNSMNSDGTFNNPQYQAMWDDMQKKEMDLYRYTGKVEILDGSTLKSQTWTGRFKLTSYSDKEDTAEMKTAISIAINDDYIAYVNQQVDKAMGKVNDQGLQEIYKIESSDTFKIELHKYSAQRLTSYQSAYQTAINVLTEQGVASESSNLHDSIYLPYYERFIALESELSYRNSQIDTLTGLEKYIEDLISKTHNDLDFESYIGEKYWKLFTYYRREDDYSNDNYISDGLTNTELIDKANELLVVAKKELVKSGEKQFTISGTLQNLLLLTDKDGNRIFEPILDDFTLGNFIRTKIDGKIYVMRLADISISYGDLSKLSVTFSDAYRYGSPDINIVKDILTKSQSMASSYSSTVKQASQGEKANLTFERLQKEGLDSALYNVHNTNSTAIFDEHGILIRSYDDVLDDYKDEQAKINVNELVYTTDRWRTAVTALGKQKYTLDGVEYEKYGLNTDFVISGVIIAGDIYSANYTTDSKGVCTAGTHFNLATGDCNIGGDTFSYNATNKKLQIKNVDIEWSTTTSPDISDVNGLSDKINSINNSIADNSKTITSVSQTAGKINWLVASGNSQASMTLTNKLYELMADNINLKGKVTFECLDSSAQSKINTAQKTADDIASNIYKANTTTIDGGKIATNTITANAISIDDLVALKATIGGWNINNEAIYHDQDDYRVYLQKQLIQVHRFLQLDGQEY